MAATRILIAAILLMGSALAAATEPDRAAEANTAFATYPKESLARGEQGVVRYKVKLDRRGRARECEVTESSGFPRLDQATCSLLMERARFSPSKDRRGRGRGSVYEGKITWRLG
ncbi:MAG TPA: energy transducer TonB [Allosphingosinicella sp.]|nr:energy transducer TonB [Allosphingosinicella sp.]